MGKTSRGSAPQSLISAVAMNPQAWRTSDLVAVGAFAALIRVVGLGIVLAGGAMNPAVLLLRNMAATALLIVLLHKASRRGVLSLYTLVSALLSLLIMGSVTSLPGVLIPALICDGLMLLAGGYRSTVRVVLAVGMYDLLCRAAALGMSLLSVRESRAMVMMAVMITVCGYAGCLAGLPVGIKLVRELRAAGIVRA